MERRNITNEFLKECIADALLKLLQERPLEDISIVEITDLAGVGRSTYYRNFNSKEDILYFKLQLLANRWIEQEKVTEDMDHMLIIRKSCEYLYNNRDLMNLFYKNNQINMVCATLYRLVGPTEADNKIVKFQKAACSFGAFGIIFQWLKDGMKEGPEELAQTIQDAWNSLETDKDQLYKVVTAFPPAK